MCFILSFCIRIWFAVPALMISLAVSGVWFFSFSLEYFLIIEGLVDMRGFSLWVSSHFSIEKLFSIVIIVFEGVFCPKSYNLWTIILNEDIYVIMLVKKKHKSISNCTIPAKSATISGSFWYSLVALISSLLAKKNHLAKGSLSDFLNS